MRAMPGQVSIKSLHLEYRLWIAELNFDINLIRIFNDRLIEISEENKSPETKKTLQGFEKKFSSSRDTIDSLRHRMHLEKMNLAAVSRENAKPGLRIPVPENYSSIRNDFFDFRVVFNDLKGEFLRFESPGA
jgi:hypothetical protein